jgi:hypothetical protein
MFPVDELRELVDFRAEHCISIYMPTYRIGADVQQNPIHLKDLIDQVEEKLSKRGLRSADVCDLLEPLRVLLDQGEFWRNQSDGLVIFTAPGFFRDYHLPGSFSDTLQINNRFFIKPLLPLMSGEDKHFILALSQNRVRLFRSSRSQIEEVNIGDVPHSLEEAMSKTSVQEYQGMSSGSQGLGGGGGDGSAIYFGHGNKKDTEKTNILQYFRQIDRGVKDLLDKDGSPLLLAGVGYLFPIYRQANTYHHLLDEGVEGNPDEVSAKELQARAWTLIQPHVDQGRLRDLERYQDLSRTDLASTDPQKIIPATFYGRVDTLFVSLDVHKWGRFDANSGALKLHSEQLRDGEDLSDAAAVQTWINNGQVYVLSPGDMPGSTGMAAIFRYALTESPGGPPT